MRRYLHYEFSELAMMSNALFNMIYMNQIYRLEMLGDEGYAQLDKMAMGPTGGLIAGLSSMGEAMSSEPSDNKSKKSTKRLVRAKRK